MPRANRLYLPGHVWHLTQRCHRKDFLLKFARDRRLWCRWLFEATRRFNLSVLSYIVTSNHVHVLVRDAGAGEIAAAMQLVAGRVAQQFNRRKCREGAFWGDRYHATAVATDEHLLQCLCYIDLNMVRAGVVQHPGMWESSAHVELRSMRRRYRILDIPSLLELTGCRNHIDLITTLDGYIEDAITAQVMRREPRWSESLAVGSPVFVSRFKVELGIGSRFRTFEHTNGISSLNDDVADYSRDFDPKNSVLSGNTGCFIY